MKTLLLILATALNLFAAESGSVLVYNGVVDSALATNVFKVTGVTNATLTGGLSLHSLNATGVVTAESFEASGDVAGSLLAIPDDDGSHFFSIEAAGTTTTSVNMVGPAAPFTGLFKATASGTNWVISQAVAGTDYAAAAFYPVVAGCNGATLGDSPNVYYIGFGYGNAADANQGRFAIPSARNCTIVGYTFTANLSTLGSNESTTIDIWVNNSTSVGSTATTFDAGQITVAVSGLSQAVTAGQTIEGRITCPTWGTNPVIRAIRFEILTQ